MPTGDGVLSWRHVSFYFRPKLLTKTDRESDESALDARTEGVEGDSGCQEGCTNRKEEILVGYSVTLKAGARKEQNSKRLVLFS